MNHTPTRRRLAAAVAGLSMVGVLIAAPRAEANPFVVQAGEAITVPFGSCTAPQVPTVSPAQAGTAVYNVDTTVTFTSSADFSGLATVSFTCSGIAAALQLQFRVERDAVSADATFTPRPAPGPCITVSLNSSGGTGTPTSIGFGDVTVGQTVTSPTTVVIGSCATITQGLTAQISDATSGSGPSQVTWEPNNGSLSPNQFSYELDIVGQTTPVPLINTPTGVATLAPVELFAATSDLTVAPGSSTGIGQQFTATLTFVAVQV